MAYRFTSTTASRKSKFSNISYLMRIALQFEIVENTFISQVRYGLPQVAPRLWQEQVGLAADIICFHQHHTYTKNFAGLFCQAATALKEHIGSPLLRRPVLRMSLHMQWYHYRDNVTIPAVQRVAGSETVSSTKARQELFQYRPGLPPAQLQARRQSVRFRILPIDWMR